MEGVSYGSGNRIPTMGMQDSHHGNVGFPPWECIVPTMGMHRSLRGNNWIVYQYVEERFALKAVPWLSIAMGMAHTGCTEHTAVQHLVC